ncbi:hypothetical protein [Nocardioides bruguierae]|uniref:ParB/Sulfiredoxin domain-containing protein n=1 Tax=Nocardioides bruguierae TaxID=2945102 RepID=A0A9X2D613_9ACTN|nr:hypothetical protein [Nocardioides bruguierae]MCM0619818.1 hypothetical protein [Nocardioides bruguierae]
MNKPQQQLFDGPRSGRRTFAPEEAASILADRNLGNRNRSASVVARYARDMAAGNWQLNGDAIRFDVDGRLIDGQHRLQACVESGVPLTSFVVWNLPREAQATMDDGRKRTMANTLQFAGHDVHAKTVSSILRRALILDWTDGARTKGGTAPSKAEMSAYYDAHPLVGAAAVAADLTRANVRCAASTLGLAYLIFARIDPAQAEEFFVKLRTGAGLEEGDPILVLRNRLTREGSTRLATESDETLAWFILAWNAKRAGRRIKILRHKTGDRFPVAA